MCGRYVLTQNLAEICAAFMAQTALPGLTPTYNAHPESKRPIIIKDRVGDVAWGWPVVPGMPPIINVRSETMAEKPMFARDVAAGRRCIVPASGFYEWDSAGQPFYVHAPDAGLLGLCGIWTRGADDTPRFAIATRAAAAKLAPIHPRMPLTATLQSARDWLQSGAFPDVPALDVYPVGTKVNMVANDGPDLLDPLPAAPQGNLFAAG